MQIPNKYENKPFKPPRLVGTTKSYNPKPFQIPLPKEYISTENSISNSSVKQTFLASDNGSINTKRRKTNFRFFTMTYRKQTTKKKKTWDGDGFASLQMESDVLTFYEDKGKILGKTSIKSTQLLFDYVMKSGSLEFQLDYEVTESIELDKLYNLLQTNKTKNPTLDFSKSNRSIPLTHAFLPYFSNAKFKPVVKKSTAEVIEKITTSDKMKYRPLFDKSKIENVLIMNQSPIDEVEIIVDPLLSKHLRPHQREGVKFIYDCIMGLARPSIDNVDASLVLQNDSDIKGCLLADEMGLGKTLMTITVIWTLLKQTPFPSKVRCTQNNVPLEGICHKIIVVCPVTLISNWKKEFIKWLPMNKIGILTLSSRNSHEKDRTDIKNFLRVQKIYQVLVIGYEKLLSIHNELDLNKQKIDLLVCDEGHRLKNGNSKILKILSNLEIERKILLSGTPIQNDLEEFYTIINFINPGIFGTFSCFKREFILPITRSRDINNKYDEDIVLRGEDASKHLIEITKRFILRRTNEILTKYLPERMDLILFCKPTNEQINAFKTILSGGFIDFGNISFNSSLGLITLFKKICNSPSLVLSDPYFKSNIKYKTNLLPQSLSLLNSGKLKVLMSLITHIKLTTNEKVIIISNYTQTLDIIQNLLISNQLDFVRLDGSTPNKQRDDIVNSFNKTASIFAFLLSAKSGGVGLNLVGGSRLILFDNDWNPSVDLQAMSRIHRDGQKNPCFIYRLLTTGCIDEKIFQRQLVKICLSKQILDESNTHETSNDDLFDHEDLKDLFTINSSTSCNTHDLICQCPGSGEEVQYNSLIYNDEVQKTGSQSSGWTNALKLKEIIDQSKDYSNKIRKDLMGKCLIGYKHINPSKIRDLIDDVATKSLDDLEETITFAFVKKGI